MANEKQKKNKLFSFKYLIYDIAKWPLGWPNFFWFRVKKQYVSKEAKKHHHGPLILVCNHVGMQDVFVVKIAYWYRRLHFAIAKEFLSRKWSKWLFTRFLCTPIDRSNTSFGALNPLTNDLKMGSVVVIFPEGRINQEGGVEQFKDGVTLLAYRSKAPVQLMYYEKRKHWYNRTRIVVGDVFNINDLIGERPTPSKIKEVSEYLREKEVELMELYHKGK